VTETCQIEHHIVVENVENIQKKIQYNHIVEEVGDVETLAVHCTIGNIIVNLF